MSLSAPRTQPLVGHLGRWGRDPLALLEEGASLGPVFGLRLWRSAVVGYSPAWNRLVLGDLTTFISKGSLSGLSPYLGGGVVALDSPGHRARRRQLNPGFSRVAVTALAEQIREVLTRHAPRGVFDAVTWSATVLRELLGVTFLAGSVPPALLDKFLGPMDRALPALFIPRPLLFRRMNAAIGRLLEDSPPHTIAGTFADLPNGIDEMRVALSAGYDTTAHTLAFLLGHAAQQPDLLEPERRTSVIDEVLRLYPSGWLGSRRATADVEFDGVSLRRGSLVLYSPYLTHRDPELWEQPLRFRPERFESPLPAWGFIPFAAGERTCLGRHFARLVLSSALDVFAAGTLSFIHGDLRPRAGVTLAPRAPFELQFQPRHLH